MCCFRWIHRYKFNKKRRAQAKKRWKEVIPKHSHQIIHEVGMQQAGIYLQPAQQNAAARNVKESPG